MRTVQLGVLMALATVAGLAQPSITAVQNAASYIPAGLPNSAIAQGSLFVVKGDRLGPASVMIATSFPLQTSFGGTSVQVNAGGRTFAAIIYYTLDKQVAAILPSPVPAGPAILTVTYNGQTSAAFSITVVANNFGMFTISQDGAGDAIAFLNGETLLSPTAAANPGNTVVFWGTGLGPVTDDETNAAKGGDMTNVPLEVYVGGKVARVLFRGRNACCSSVDTVYVEVPQGVAGCVTPVTMKIGNLVSNTASIPVAASGRVCTPTAISGGDLSKLLGKDTFTIGGLSLTHTVTVTQPITIGPVTVPGMTTRIDVGGGAFLKFQNTPGAAGLSTSFDVATYGSCIVTITAGTATPRMPGVVQWLDAGNSLSVSGPSGSRALPKTTFSSTVIYGGTLDMAGNYLTAGQYTLTGPGGPDIGAFTVNLTLPPQLMWTNQASTTTVNRANGVTVTWTGGDPNGYVQITGSSFAGTTAANRAGATFTCTARTSDLSFTVPAIVLLALPPSGMQSQGGISIPIPGILSISGNSVSVPLQATGLDFGGVGNISVSASAVVYQ